MLRHMKADTNGRWIPIPNLEIDIADATVEGELVSIDNLLTRRRLGRRKLEHVLSRAWESMSGLVAGSIRREHEDWPLLAVADQTDTGPEMQRCTDAVTPLRQKNDALIRCFGDSVERGLEAGRIVRNAVPLHAERAVCSDGEWVWWKLRVQGLGPNRGRCKEENGEK